MTDSKDQTEDLKAVKDRSIIPISICTFITSRDFGNSFFDKQLLSRGIAISKGREKRIIALLAFTGTISISYIPFILRLVDPYFEVQTFPANGSDALWWVMLMHLCVTDIFSVRVG